MFFRKHALPHPLNFPRILLTQINQYIEFTTIPEYSQEALDSMLIFFFLLVPSWACLTVAYHVLYKNAAFRFFFHCLDWDTFDEKVKRLDARLGNIDRRFSTRKLADTPPKRARVLDMVPETFKEAVDQLRLTKVVIEEEKAEGRRLQARGDGLQVERNQVRRNLSPPIVS